MKILFVGPSLPDARLLVEGQDIEITGPAVQGDVAAAVRRGATAIGIVDGGFEYTAPVRHKEILFALSQDVAVYGAASMGALRAAECKAFGMIGVGRIFHDYDSGIIVDDADVALLHAPAELGYRSLTLALVNVRATLDGLEQTNRLAHDARILIETSANHIFFKDRTWRSVVDNCAAFGSAQKAELVSLLRAGAIDQKRVDALSLIEVLQAAGGHRPEHERSWHFNETFQM
jgi:hypothetical protein